MNDFSTSIDELEAAVLGACARQNEWPAKVVAGICAALDFAAANPEAARTLAIEARSSGHDYRRMIDQFSELLSAEAPRDQRLVASTDKALVGGIATIVADHLRAERLDGLTHAAPGLVYLTLVPYLGFDEAKRWAESTAC